MDRAYLAKQFNGPIISAFFKCVYDFFHKENKVDEHLSYFKDLNIDNAEEQQLDTIGRLMGLQRLGIFSININTDGNIVFVNNYVEQEEYNDSIGIAEEYVNKLEQTDYPAGKLTLTQYGDNKATVLPVAQFRTILKLLSETTDILSIKFITNVTYSILETDKFTWQQTQPDIFVLDYDKNINPVLIAKLRLVLDSIYSNYILFYIS